MDVLSPNNKVLVCIHKMCKYSNALCIKYQLCVNMLHFLDLGTSANEKDKTE